MNVRSPSLYVYTLGTERSKRIPFVCYDTLKVPPGDENKHNPLTVPIRFPQFLLKDVRWRLDSKFPDHPVTKTGSFVVEYVSRLPLSLLSLFTCTESLPSTVSPP